MYWHTTWHWIDSVDIQRLNVWQSLSMKSSTCVALKYLTKDHIPLCRLHCNVIKDHIDLLKLSFDQAVNTENTNIPKIKRIIIYLSARLFLKKIKPEGMWDILERMRTSVRHISYGIRHTALSLTYAIVAYVRHNNNAGSLYLVFQDFPIDPNRLSSRWSSSMHGTSVLLTHFFDSKHMGVNDRRH